MRFPRASGILLHPTSLPGRHGIGDLGPEAHAFLQFLAETSAERRFSFTCQQGLERVRRHYPFQPTRS